MEEILRERGLWPEKGLPAQCPDFKCPAGHMNCCCRRVLFHQPDFAGQHSQLEELIESRGHLCDFYPKYHCELNFIEQYWGAVKAQYRVVPRAKTVREMENTVKECLDSVPLPQIRRSVLLSLFLPSFLCLIFISVHLGSQIEPLISLVLTGVGSQVHKPHGRIRNTMVIGCYHPRPFLKPRVLSACRPMCR